MNYLYLLTRYRRRETHFVILRLLFENIPISSRMHRAVFLKRKNCVQFYDLLCKMVKITFSEDARKLLEGVSSEA